jgi:hypothetical protein
MIAIPIIWIKLANVAGIRFGTSTDPFQFLTSIAAIMGTVFVVGGLIIALTAVITLFDVERRIEQRVEALIPDLERRADKQIQAHILVRQAEAPSSTWQETLAQCEQALRDYPAVTGARRAVARQTSKVVLGSFQWHHGYLSNESAVYAATTRQNLPIDEAIRWLEDAIDQHEDTHNELLTQLALMYAIRARRSKVLEILPMIRRDMPQRNYLAAPGQLIALIHACATVNEVQKLGEALGTQLPLSINAVRASLSHLSYENGPTDRQWWAIERAAHDSDEFLQDERQPVGIRFRRGPLGQGADDLQAYLPITTSIGEAVYGDELSAYRPEAELLGRLEGDYVFICQQDEMFHSGELPRSYPSAF